MAKPPRRKKTTTKSAAGKKPTASRASTKKSAPKKAAAKKKIVKKTTKKKVVKKTASKKTASKKATTAKKTTKKAVSKKPAAKKPASKKASSKKPASKKTASKKTASKKPATKKAPLKKPSSKKATSKKTVAKKAPAKKPVAKKATAKKATAKPASPKPAEKAAAKPSEAAGDAKKTGRKGITIVSDRKKKTRTKAPRKPFITPGKSLLGPGVVRKPLIPSGPKAPAAASTETASTDALKKSPFNKRELTKFKTLLLIKRAEVFGDIEQMEADALRSNSGNLSHLPQHLADQGSDSYEQTLSLNLAAADRRLIKEIDDALARIDAKTYGICERTGKAIRETRLKELPWARYSIEAAREMERRGGN